jgi:hypothetical protein
MNLAASHTCNGPYTEPINIASCSPARTRCNTRGVISHSRNNFCTISLYSANLKCAGVAERFNAFACKANVWGFDSTHRRSYKER